MSAQKDSEMKAAFLLPVEEYVDKKGNKRTRAAVGGDPEAADAMIKYLQETADAHLETPEETARARSFAGFGKGSMDASKGRRTKIVLKRRSGGGFPTVG